ncbi:unnamed protein product [Brassicogethes aeneus]|uniref:Uncharacterized protein n=1 Tax=Brassicogethes aeneus TaxID=1431903 RepID=A0A9P0FCU4_BRAAE|nr:unnamed protein product [Brassicogethes aeneus]
MRELGGEGPLQVFILLIWSTVLIHGLIQSNGAKEEDLYYQKDYFLRLQAENKLQHNYAMKYPYPPKMDKIPNVNLNFQNPFQDYGPTLGWSRKQYYNYKACDMFNNCEIRKVNCMECPDPLHQSFRLYDVERRCIKCYQQTYLS